MSEYAYPSLSCPTLYERNFDRLLALLPALAPTEETPLMLNHGGQCLTVEVIERHKFTLVIRLSQALPLPVGPASTTLMTVRVYFDARVAEVLAYQHHRRFHPKYDYPNVDMLQVREKRRVNEFLGDWLESHLAQSRHGLTTA